MMRPRQKGLFLFDRLGGPIGDFGRLDRFLTRLVSTGSYIEGEKSEMQLELLVGWTGISGTRIIHWRKNDDKPFPI